MVEIFDNIRKLYQFQAPCPELAQHIEFFSETSLEATNHYIQAATFTVKLFPSFTPTIWLNLGSPYHLKNGDQLHLIDAHADILLLRNEIVERKNLPTDNIFTVKFNPGGFEAVFGIPQTKIGSHVINVNHFIPDTILRKLKRLDGFDDRKRLLEQLFLEKLAKHNKAAHALQYVRDMIDAFYVSGMEHSNQELARQFYLTNKTLYRYFTHVIGASPKSFFGTVRARTALTAYVGDKSAFSPYTYGYYDMSHFYKDVVRFTGQKLSSVGRS
jgi:AraC-like DNA-binding protein